MNKTGEVKVKYMHYILMKINIHSRYSFKKIIIILHEMCDVAKDHSNFSLFLNLGTEEDLLV